MLLQFLAYFQSFTEKSHLHLVCNAAVCLLWFSSVLFSVPFAIMSCEILHNLS